MAVNSNTQIYDKAIDRAAMIRLYEQKVNKKIELVINGHIVRLDTLIKNSKDFKSFQKSLGLELTKT